MKPLGAGLRSCVITWWIFAALARCQGGSYGWVPGNITNWACNGTYVNLTSPSLSNFVGCINSGGNSTTQLPTRWAQNSTNITWGTGTYMPPFYVNSSGPTSFPGFLQDGTSTFTSFETPWNCTIACRAHGMKYIHMVYGSCACSPFYHHTPFYNTLGQPDTGYAPQAVGWTDACTPWDQAENGQHGDNSQYYQGYEINALGWTYSNGYAYGTVAITVFVDTTFASDSQLALSNQAALYQYLACFIMSSSSTTFMPLGFFNNFTTAAQCYTFCSNLNMPYAGMAYQVGT